MFSSDFLHFSEFFTEIWIQMSTPMLSTAPTLGSGNLRDVVRLPLGENENEWLAVNIIDVFNQIHMLYGTICDVCTHESCPLMNAGPNHEWFWKDGENM